MQHTTKSYYENEFVDFYSAFADVMIYSNYLQLKAICAYVSCYSKWQVLDKLL